jgi:ABC-type transport system involved in cytochrome c biogenesis permease subunit
MNPHLAQGRSRRCMTAFLVLVVALTSACGKRPEHKVQVSEPRTFAYTDEMLAAAGDIPVQHLGRIKPLSTVASFSLLKIKGKSKHKLPVESGLPTAGERLDPTAWLLDVLLYPEQAAKYEVFLVEDSAVLTGVGLHFEDRKRRDHYSYDQLAPARQKIMEAARAAHAKDQRQRSPVDQQSLELHQRMGDFEALADTLSYARVALPADVPQELLTALGDAVDTKRQRLTATAFLTKREALRAALDSLDKGDAAQQAGLRAFEAALSQGLGHITENTVGALAFVAPEVPHTRSSGGGREEWDTPGDVLAGAASDSEPRMRQIELLDALAAAVRERHDPAQVAARLGATRDVAVGLAEARGDYHKIQMERTYYRIDFFYKALYTFILAFILAAFSWMAPSTAWLGRAVTWTTAVGCLIVIAGVTMRCVLRGRPPVVSLYDTILFITGTGVLTALVLGRLTRLSLASTLGAFLGATGMFMANRYELREAATTGDTIATVQAVLDTNFWLATHVTTVTLGYAAGLLACLFAHVWLAARFTGFRSDDIRWHRQLGRAVYGIIAFGLLFSVVGTILGGIWANDSWGRFWGWDPKENGALMICLFELALVHARLGGYIKDFGVCVAAVILGPIVAFSWWHVNLLGVGLHSYGFTAGIKEKLFAYYAFEIAVALAALAWWALGGRHRLGQRPPASEPAPQP